VRGSPAGGALYPRAPIDHKLGFALYAQLLRLKARRLSNLIEQKRRLPDFGAYAHRKTPLD
jgi:hypothetical protein